MLSDTTTTTTTTTTTKFKSLKRECNGLSKNDAITLTNSGLDMAIQCLEKINNAFSAKNYDEFLCNLLKKYFLIEDTNDKGLTAIANTINVVLTNLKDPGKISLEIRYFNRGPSGNTMELALAQVKNKNQIVRYMIHEATHMFAKTVDIGGYINDDGEFRENVMNREMALVNADCIAVLVVKYAGLPLK